MYPLYDELLRKVRQRKDKTIDIKRVCTTINNIAQTMSPEETKKHYEEILALIIHHERVASGMVLSVVPFDGKTMVGGKGVLFTMNKLPPTLQQIIAQYIEEMSHIA